MDEANTMPSQSKTEHYVTVVDIYTDLQQLIIRY